MGAARAKVGKAKQAAKEAAKDLAQAVGTTVAPGALGAHPGRMLGPVRTRAGGGPWRRVNPPGKRLGNTC